MRVLRLGSSFIILSVCFTNCGFWFMGSVSELGHGSSEIWSKAGLGVRSVGQVVRITSERQSWLLNVKGNLRRWAPRWYSWTIRSKRSSLRSVRRERCCWILFINIWSLSKRIISVCSMQRMEGIIRTNPKSWWVQLFICVLFGVVSIVNKYFFFFVFYHNLIPIINPRPTVWKLLKSLCK